MIKPSVYVQEDWAPQTIDMFSSWGFPIVTSPELADIVAFNGGEDIHPSIYHEDVINAAGCYYNKKRDERELAVYEKSQGKFKFGICRGGQLLNCVNGGRLWHDVDNHHRAHPMTDLETGQTIWTSSVHHQQFILGPEAVMVAVARESTNRIGYQNKRPYRWWSGDVPAGHTSLDDPEVVWYPKDRALCIQGHPEYDGYTQMTAYSMGLIERYI